MPLMNSVRIYEGNKYVIKVTISTNECNYSWKVISLLINLEIWLGNF